MAPDEPRPDRSSRSRTRVAVLGALSVEPMTGYEIRRGIEQSIGHFWHESFGQIYPVLRELEQQGLVTSAPTESGRGHRFTITAGGRSALTDLLADLGNPPPPRNTLLLQLFFGRQLGPEWCRNRIAEARLEATDQLAVFDRIVAEIEGDEQHAEHRAYWLSTVRFGQAVSRAIVEWADEVADSLPST